MSIEPPSPRLVALLRAAAHVGRQRSETDLVQAILTDTVAVLDAQRGVVALADETDHLRVWAKVGDMSGRFHFSHKLGERCIRTGESILCGTTDEPSEFAPGEMSSVICALLRTPRRRLGVLHLDRNRQQPPFTSDDLHFADAIAAMLAMGIAGAELGGRG